MTGASSGIGRLLALRLAREGARVALVARRRHALEEVAEAIRAGGGEALVLPADVAEREAAEAAARAAVAGLGGVDLLVNNAGHGAHRPFLECSVGEMERLMRVHYFGALAFTRALLPAMVERRRGWLVFMASVAGRIASPDEAAYTAAKSALVGLASALSLELEDEGVHVLTVLPGVIETPFFDAETRARMPDVSLRQMKAPEGLIEAILAALARGRRELTYPRWIAPAYAVQALAPGFMRRQVLRATRARPLPP